MSDDERLDAEQRINNIRLSLGPEAETGTDVTSEIAVEPIEEILVPTRANSSNSNSNSNLPKASSGFSTSERKARPQKDATFNCPKCDSTNTKFCYYDNYSLSQPRYFCKTCKKYWTEVGTRKNVPVGGGSRKNKRSSSSSSSSSSPPPSPSPSSSSSSSMLPNQLMFPSTSNSEHVSKALQPHNLDATRITNSSVSTSITTDTDSVYTPSEQLMIPMTVFKIPSPSGSLDRMGNGNNRGLFFPFQEPKANTSATHDDDDDDPHGGQNKDQKGDSNGFWNGMMDRGSWIKTVSGDDLFGFIDND